MSKGRKTTRPTYRIAYLRVSTEEQGASGLGLAAQRSMIEAECQRRGWDEPTYITDVATGKHLDRPGMADALDALTAGRASTLIVAKQDRLTRSLVDFAGLIERARADRWELVALDSKLDMSTPTGEMVAGIMAVTAQHERRLIAERTRSALAAKKAAGARLGRPRLLSDDVAQRIADLRAAGGTVRGVAAQLTAEGVPTATGGTVWHPTAVARALRSLDLDAEARSAVFRTDFMAGPDYQERA